MYRQNNHGNFVTERHVGITTLYYHIVAKLKLHVVLLIYKTKCHENKLKKSATKKIMCG